MQADLLVHSNTIQSARVMKRWMKDFSLSNSQIFDITHNILDTLPESLHLWCDCQLRYWHSIQDFLYAQVKILTPFSNT
jgi:hypothetical protein